MENFVPLLSVLVAIVSAFTGMLAWFTVSRRQVQSEKLSNNLTRDIDVAQSVFLGRLGGKAISLRGEGSIITFGTTGSGKTQTLAKAVSVYSGQVLAFDPRGGLGSALQRYGTKRLVWFGGSEGLFLNPFDLLDSNDAKFDFDCAHLADLVVPKLASSESDSSEYFIQAARSLVLEAIKEVAASPSNEDRTLYGLRVYVERGMRSLQAENNDVESIVQRLGEQMGERAASSVLVTALSSLGRFDETFGHSSNGALEAFLESGSGDVVLFSEPDGGYRSFYSTVMIGFILSKDSSTSFLEQRQRLVVLDDASFFLAHDFLEKWVALGRASESRIWTVYQSVSQLRSLSRTSSEAMIANAEVIQFLSVTDHDTIRLFNSLVDSDVAGRIALERGANIVTTSGRLLKLDKMDFNVLQR